MADNERESAQTQYSRRDFLALFGGAAVGAGTIGGGILAYNAATSGKVVTDDAENLDADVRIYFVNERNLDSLIGRNDAEGTVQLASTLASLMGNVDRVSTNISRDPILGNNQPENLSEEKLAEATAGADLVITYIYPRTTPDPIAPNAHVISINNQTFTQSEVNFLLDNPIRQDFETHHPELLPKLNEVLADAGVSATTGAFGNGAPSPSPQLGESADVTTELGVPQVQEQGQEQVPRLGN